MTDAAAVTLPEGLVEAFRQARRPLFITGAGLSADSGLPTYRGVGGLYDDAATDEGFTIEEALSGTMLRQRPEVCWRYIRQIESACRGAQPNRGHSILAAFEAERPGTWVLTQNVDGFHRAAGSRQVIEIHGELGRLLCTRCDAEHRVPDHAALPALPQCADCGGVLRPAVVLFGEMLPAAATRTYMQVLQAGPDLVVTIGTSSVFPYIAGPVHEARARGVPTVEIDPGTTEVSRLVTYRVRARAAAALELIWAALHPEAGPSAPPEGRAPGAPPRSP